MLENDLTNIDTRKSNLNKLTQFIPEPLRAMVYNLACSSQCNQVKSIEKLSKHYYIVYFINQFDDDDFNFYRVDDNDYWDRLSHIEVDVEEIQLPIIPN